jgi:hypothetical protein
LQELFAQGEVAGREEGLDVGGHAFAYAGNGEKLFGVISEGGELRRLLFDCLGGTAIGADSEGVSAVNLEQCSGFVEQAGDRDIVHGDAIRVRERIRTLSQYATDRRGTQGGEGCKILRMRMGDSAQAETRLVTYFVTNFFETRDLIGLRTFRSLDDVEFNLVTLFKAFVSLALNGAVMDKDVCPALSAEEAVPFCVVEPLYCALVLCQWSHSLVSYLSRLRAVK